MTNRESIEWTCRVNELLKEADADHLGQFGMSYLSQDELDVAHGAKADGDSPEKFVAELLADRETAEAERLRVRLRTMSPLRKAILVSGGTAVAAAKALVAAGEAGYRDAPAYEGQKAGYVFPPRTDR